MSLVRDAYLQEVQGKKAQIQKIVERKFPAYLVEVRGGYDSPETIHIILYCVEKERVSEVVDQLEDLIEDMATILEYLMPLSIIKTIEVTQEYYPEIYEKWENNGTR